MAQILIIDDEAAFREGIIETITDLSHEAIGVGSVKEALALIDEKPFDAVLVDFRMPEINGLEAIRLIQEKTKRNPVPIIMITAFIDSGNTIEAMKTGAFDHLTKPIGRSDIEKVLAGAFKAYPPGGKAEAAKKSDAVSNKDSLIGRSSEIREVLKTIGRLAANESSVLITGETGTGKELVAKAIHINSSRSRFPLVAINCASIPENLLESELFGHVKGAFTGAVSDRKGSFQQAEGGTIFLDEIGDMSLALQAKLLRALQEREIRPVGGSKSIKFDARFVAATHQNLKSMVDKKVFREDLFYRLNVVEIKLPALRDRAGDIPILANHFLNQDSGFQQKVLSLQALQKLSSHRWPGNIRELKNVIERAMTLSHGLVIGEDDIRLLDDRDESHQVESENLDLPSAIMRLERTLILKALSSSSGNRSEAARKLGIQRQLLYTKMKEHRIENDSKNRDQGDSADHQ